MGQKLLTMSKMTRSCHDIVMWANVHPLCLYTTATSGIANVTHIMYTLSTESTMTMEQSWYKVMLIHVKIDPGQTVLIGTLLRSSSIVIVTFLTPKGPRVFQWKNGQNYPLLKNTLVIIFSTTFYCF
jgi:hypothetical protein